MVIHEKRGAARVIKRLEVKFLAPEEKIAITGNISAGGLFIRTSRGLDPGKMVEMMITLPNSFELFLKGSVTRNARTVPGLIGQAKSGMGIRLIDPSQDYMQYLQSLHA